jgi:tRNA U34 2-thiouridine synthase MnmA/TrmU
MKYEISSNALLYIKSRSTQRPVEGIVSRIKNRFHITFSDPQTGISPGQSAVFYDKDDDVVGGGIIDKICD